MKQRVMIWFWGCMLLWAHVGLAAEATPWTHSFYFENDLFNGTDGYYTNGVKYSIIRSMRLSEATQKRLPRRVLELIHNLPFCTAPTPEYTHKIEFAFGQNIYTPSDISTEELIADDRPYAGWTYISSAYHRRYNGFKRFRFMDTVETQLGIVGPESFAEQTQKFVHKQRGIRRPKGWDNQLKNEPGLAVVFERKWLLHPTEAGQWGYSAISHLGCALGNVHTYLNSGMEFRFGWNVPNDFGVSLIRPAGSTRLEIANGITTYLFLAVNERFVARNIFLDGNTFTDSHGVDKNYFVADMAGGLAVGYKRLMLTLTQVVRTREFKGQDKSHRFGAIVFSFSLPLGP